MQKKTLVAKISGSFTRIAAMSSLNIRRLSGVFSETETKALRDAYVLALRALAMTHEVDDHLKAHLADIVINICMTEVAPKHRYFVEASALAARSVERYLTFHNLARLDLDATLH